jgi:hypothetical protein
MEFDPSVAIPDGRLDVLGRSPAKLQAKASELLCDRIDGDDLR